MINKTPYVFLNGRVVEGAIKDKSPAESPRQPINIHEIMHNLIGNRNAAHMMGGGPLSDGSVVSLDYQSGGWSLIGSANSSLISCNAYERWKLNWRGPENLSHRIAVNGSNSDITKADGSKTFYLRDFVTTGDAVRIKLPYRDAGSLDQFLWLENHQIHQNNKLDFPAFWQDTCKDDGTAGVYAYIQVGKNLLQATTVDSLLPAYTDHMFPLCADGNWDIRLTGDYMNPRCVSWSDQPIQEYFQENPLSGYCDLENHLFDTTARDTLNWIIDATNNMVKIKNGILYNNLSSNGDNTDAFTDNSEIGISTNPTPFNIVTYSHRRYGGGVISKSSAFVENRKIHLSGLNIKISNYSSGMMIADIVWDDYDLDNSVMWAGDIVLHEELNVTSGNVLTVDQNLTPNKHIRDSYTNLFAGPTYLTCEGNSELTLESNSEMIVKNNSALILENESSLTINDSAVLRIQSGSTLLVESGGVLHLKGSGKVEIEDGAYICLSMEADLILEDNLSIILLRPGYNSGVNTNVLPSTSCSNPKTHPILSGDGSVMSYDEDIYIQDITISTDSYYYGRNIYIGYEVTTPPYGPVIINNNAQVFLEAENDIVIPEDLTVNSGAIFEIDK